MKGADYLFAATIGGAALIAVCSLRSEQAIKQRERDKWLSETKEARLDQHKAMQALDRIATPPLYPSPKSNNTELPKVPQFIPMSAGLFLDGADDTIVLTVNGLHLQTWTHLKIRHGTNDILVPRTNVNALRLSLVNEGGSK